MERALEIGARRSLPVDLWKRIRLSNLLALWGSAIMAPWAAVEVTFGRAANVPWELGFLASFLAVLTLNAIHAHRAARLLLIFIANACVFTGALMFEDAAGGALPLFALVGVPLLLFGPSDKLIVAAGAALPAVLFALYHDGAVARLLSIHPAPAPRWYFAANAASAFVVAFVVPFFFYRANLKAEASLEQIGREKLRRVIDSNLIGVVRGRLSGRIEEANDTFLALLGYTREDLASGAINLQMIAPLDAGDHGASRAIAELSRPGAGVVRERTFVRKDGATIPALVGVAPLDRSCEEVVGFVLDLTAQKRVEAQKAMLRESQEALRLRDLFNSIASHELKTPLAALMLNLHMLRRRMDKEAPASTALRSQVERCEAAGSRMGQLIHTLLDVAQFQDGKLKLAPQEIDVAEAVRRIAAGFEVGRNGDCQPIRVEAEPSLIATLDPLRFDQVVMNLLSNATKYGFGKPIDVRVSRDPAADAVRIEVIDRGPGIQPEMFEKIFEPFQRAVAADERIPGLGLGLYVVKMIAESHGGSVDVKSRLGQGSRFTVTLPSSVPAGLSARSLAPEPHAEV